MHADYFETLRAISQPIRAAALPHTLAHVRRLMNALGSPQQHYRSIVVTGSTGKGTTCLRLADALRRSGLRVGLYTSPHLHLFRERFAVLDALEKGDAVGARRAVPSSDNLIDTVGAHGGAPSRMITQQDFADTARLVLDAAQSLDWHYSTFESATAIALSWFAQQQIDLAVLEVGIGGRFDAVNVVHNDLAVFTPIEAEHVAMLGGSLESVAWHKAGIIQPGGQAISVPQTPEVMAVLEREAREQGAAIHIANDIVEHVMNNHLLTPSTPSPFSRDQRSRYADGEKGSITPLPINVGEGYDAPVSGVRGYLPGRLERTPVNGRSVIIDGGHTPAAARYLRDFIGDAESIRLIVGMLRDKNAAAYLSIFDAPNVHFVYTHAPGDRALSPDDLLARFAPQQASVTLVPSLDAALHQVETAQEALCVVAGSLRMAAAAREAYGLLAPGDLDEARRTRAIFEGEDYQKKLG